MPSLSPQVWDALGRLMSPTVPWSNWVSKHEMRSGEVTQKSEVNRREGRREDRREEKGKR